MELERISNRTWIAMVHVKPKAGSEFERDGLRGRYGFVACTAPNIVDCVSIIAAELEGQGMSLAGFEWLSNLSDRKGELNDYQLDIVNRLGRYPVQFQEFDWYEDV